MDIVFTNVETAIEVFSEEYLEKVFYFCLKKLGNQIDAQELSQDIALNVLSSLRRSDVPSNFSAWVWKIARNRYARFIEKKKRTDNEISSDEVDDIGAEWYDDTLDNMVREEELSALRRELAFIGADYRNIIVEHYFENRSIREISAMLSLSEDAVKKRLQRARKTLKEGMKMAREFGKRSYNPEQVSFVMNGQDGENGQPWSIITHLLYKNIFLETYENPQTAQELSLELGIALPYLEDELEFLVRETLLKKDGNKYETNFPIVSREEQIKNHEMAISVADELTEKLCALIDLYINEDGAKVDHSFVGLDNAKWVLLTKAFDWADDDSNEAEVIPYPDCYPARPDNGRWELTGFEDAEFDEPNFVGQHGAYARDNNEIKIDINYGQYKYYVGNHQAKTPVHLSYKESETLWFVCNGKGEACEKAYIDALLKYGYLKKVGDEIKPNLVVFDHNAKSRCSKEVGDELSKLYKEAIALIKKAPSISRGYVIDKAIENGWLIYSDDMMPTVGAFIYK